jgi:thioredoxin 1
MAKPVEITDTNFEQEVLKSDVPVLIDFWAVWCGPCKVIAPVVEEIAGEYEGKLKVGKLHVDNNPQVAVKYGIRSIPTLLIFNNGEVSDQLIGALPKAQIVDRVERVM